MSDEHTITNHDPTAVEMDVQVYDDGDVILDSGGDEMLVLEEERGELSALLSVETSVEDDREINECPSVMTVENADDAVALDTLVDVADASDDQKQMYQDIASIYEQQFRTFVKKNQDYGNAVIDGGVRDASRDGGPFDDPLVANLYKIWTRLNDKGDRFYEQVFGGGNDFVGENVSETTGDGMNYYAILTWLLLYGEDE